MTVGDGSKAMQIALGPTQSTAAVRTQRVQRLRGRRMVTPGPLSQVTGTSNVYMVDFVAGTSTPPDVSSGSESSQCVATQPPPLHAPSHCWLCVLLYFRYTDRRYHVLTWNNVRDTLFAGGSHLDIFKPVRTAE